MAEQFAKTSAGRQIHVGSLPWPVRTVGNDMDPPYGVYVNGDMIAECSSEAEACDLHNQLRRLLPPKGVRHG